MELMTVEEVARSLRVSLPRAYVLLEEAKIPHIRLSARRIRIPRREFENWLMDQTSYPVEGMGGPVDLEAA